MASCATNNKSANHQIKSKNQRIIRSKNQRMMNPGPSYEFISPIPKLFKIENISPYRHAKCEFCSMSSNSSPKGMYTVFTSNESNRIESGKPSFYNPKIMCALCCDNTTGTNFINGKTFIANNTPLYK